MGTPPPPPQGVRPQGANKSGIALTLVQIIYILLYMDAALFTVMSVFALDPLQPFHEEELTLTIIPYEISVKMCVFSHVLVFVTKDTDINQYRI